MAGTPGRGVLMSALQVSWRLMSGSGDLSLNRSAELTRKGVIQMKFRPLHDRIVVKRITAEEKTSGGIIIPDTAKEKPMEGEVIAAGPGARNEQGAIGAAEVK